MSESELPIIQPQNGGGDLQPKNTSKGKKRRHRPATKGIRSELKALVENAILDVRSELLSTIFSASSEDGTLAAPLSTIFEHLRKLGHNIVRFTSLSKFALKSISNRTRVFSIVERESGGTPEQQLWVHVSTQVRAHTDEKTVYLDNLPPFGTKEKLRKRASFFGRVVSIHLPQIGRIQRRMAHLIGGTRPEHCGFGFVQFASKTAAKRFCRRYAANSRLKRIHHHHHGHKHGKKKGASKTAQQMESSDSKNVTSKPDDHSGGVEIDASAVDEGLVQNTDVVPLQESVDSQPVPQQQGSLVTPSYFNTSVCSTLSGGSNEGTRFRCYSVAEESVFSESGNETDTNMGRPETECRGEARTSGDVKSNRKRRKRRRLVRPWPAHQSLNALFRHIQVFPLKQYRELRTDYLRMKKTRMAALKKQLKGDLEKKADKIQSKTLEKKQQSEEEVDRPKQTEKRKRKIDNSRKRRRKRGTRKLLERAEQTKKEAQKLNT